MESCVEMVTGTADSGISALIGALVKSWRGIFFDL